MVGCEGSRALKGWTVIVPVALTLAPSSEPTHLSSSAGKANGQRLTAVPLFGNGS